MKKNEWIYREILYRVIEKGERFFTQKALSERCGVSIGNVNKSLSVLEKMNAIEKKPRGFSVINWKKILLYWASSRNLEKDIVYQTRADENVTGIEKSLPQVLFTAYSGYKFAFGAVPADYSEVVVYGDEEKIMERFGKKEGKPNLIVLKMDAHLRKFRKPSLTQIYVDLWNLGTWYAEDFLKELEKRLEGMVSQKRK
jgi:DNA-binding transcriptional MocR family regulator